MLTGGRGHQASAGCGVRCIYVVLLLEFLLFSLGSASPSRKEIGDSVVAIENSLTAAEKLRKSLNYHPALQESEAHFTQMDSFFSEVSLDSRSRPVLLSLVRRFVTELVSSTVLDSRSVEKMVLVGTSKEGSEVTSSTSGSGSRRLGPRYYSLRRSSSSRSLRALDQQQRQITHNEGQSRVLEETVSSPAATRTQVARLGPPAPAELLNNEKQDWNQDYAEPDVHPPSSN